MNPRSDQPALPAQPFFSTPQQRLALARQRYFEEGVRPSGLVRESVIQSWSRCVQDKRDPVETIAFNPVTPSRVHSALAHSQLLLESAAFEMDQLETTLAGTGCSAILTDPGGVVVHSTRVPTDNAGLLLTLARRVGVSLDEGHIGTGAPGVTLRTGKASLVLGAEHFFGHMQRLHCAAAPIRDVHGRLAAVLDLTCEGRPFGFDAGGVVALYATTIENRLLEAQSTEHVVVQLQTSPSLLGTPMEGLAGLDSNGAIAWVNNAGARLLGMAQSDVGQRAESVFGVDASVLVRATLETEPSPHRLPNGLTVWWRARMQSRDGGTRVHAPVAARRNALTDSSTGHGGSLTAAAPGTLRANDRTLVEQTLAACGGNVSQAARQLGVSRGRVYRLLGKAGASTKA